MFQAHMSNRYVTQAHLVGNAVRRSAFDQRSKSMAMRKGARHWI